MAVLLYDETKEVGCSKVCCDKRELIICDFGPIIQNVNLNDLAMHIKANKFLK